MPIEKEFMYKLYNKYFFEMAERTKRAAKLSVDKLEEKYLLSNEIGYDLKNVLDCDNYHRTLYSITKSIVAIEEKNIPKIHKQKLEKIKKNVINDLHRLCDADIAFFHKKYPEPSH